MFRFKSILPFVLCLSLQSLAWAQPVNLTQLLTTYITQANNWVEATERGEYLNFMSGRSYENSPPHSLIAAFDEVCIHPNEPFTDIIPQIYQQAAYDIARHQCQQSEETLIDKESDYEATFNTRFFPYPHQSLTYATVGGLRAFIVFGSLGYEFTDLVVFDRDPRVCAYNAIEALLLAISTSVEDYRSLHLDAPIEAWKDRLQAHNIEVDDLILKRLYAFQRVAIFESYAGWYNLAKLFFDADDQVLWKAVRYSFRKRPYERLHTAAQEGRMQFVQESVGPDMPQFFGALQNAYEKRGARLGLLDLTNIVRLKRLGKWANPAVSLPFYPKFYAHEKLTWVTPENCFGFIHALVALLERESAIWHDSNGHLRHSEPIVLPSTVLIGTDHYRGEEGELLLCPFALPLFSLVLEAQVPDLAGAYARPDSEGLRVNELVRRLGVDVQTRFHHWGPTGVNHLSYPVYQYSLKNAKKRYAQVKSISERVYYASLPILLSPERRAVEPDDQRIRGVKAVLAYTAAKKRSQSNALPPSRPVLLNPEVPQNRTQGRSPLSEEPLEEGKIRWRAHSSMKCNTW